MGGGIPSADLCIGLTAIKAGFPRSVRTLLIYEPLSTPCGVFSYWLVGLNSLFRARTATYSLSLTPILPSVLHIVLRTNQIYNRSFLPFPPIRVPEHSGRGLQRHQGLNGHTVFPL